MAYIIVSRNITRTLFARIGWSEETTLAPILQVPDGRTTNELVWAGQEQ